MDERIIVVFDVNVYLDAASIIGEPFSWAALSDKLAEQFNKVPDDHRIHALRSVAMGSSGRLAGNIPLEVWTSDHIDSLVKEKAEQSNDDSLHEVERGLGWSVDHAAALLDDLVWKVVSDSGGNTVGDIWLPRSTPPLSHEDGLVCATAREADVDDVECRRLILTSDRGFLEHCGAKDAYPRALSPAQFVQLVQRARAQFASKQIRGIA
jgi:hypothetical protein